MVSGAHIVLSGIELVITGIVIGVLVAAPIGPVNVLVIQRAAASGFWAGVAAGIGAMLGDGMLAAIAAFSVTAVSDLMFAHAHQIQFIGGLVLIGFGVALLLAKPRGEGCGEEVPELRRHWSIVPQTFFLTVTNPGAILGMIAIFGGLGSLIGGINSYLEALILIASVMGGSLLWWLGLSELIATIRHRLTESRLKLINRIAGIVLAAFGVLLVVQGLLRLMS